MGDCYYIGKGQKRRKKHTFLLRISIVFSVLLALFILWNTAFYPPIAALTESAITNRITTIAAEKTSEVLAQSRYTYEDLIKIAYAENGRVSTVSVDTVKLNLLRFQIASAVLSALTEQDITVTIPLSNALGIVFLSGFGNVPCKVRCAESMLAGFSSSFAECGINQTRHSLCFEMEITVFTLTPLFVGTHTIACTLPATDTIIVGDVPDSFTDISRLTDAVSEIDIDDAVDFGNVLGGSSG